MTRQVTIILCVVLGIQLAATAGSDQPARGGPPVRLLLSEVQAGTMASEQYCTLVFADGRFHFEKAIRKTGKDRDRKVYEGQLSDGDWNKLGGILEDRALRELRVPQEMPPMIVEDAHTFTISVARDTKYQNMEFLDNKSRKPYEAQLKPLMEWWKTFRKSHMAQPSGDPDPKCSLDSSRGVFSN
jgi:hypothetical protein